MLRPGTDIIQVHALIRSYGWLPSRDWLQPWIIFPSVLLALVALVVLSLLLPWFSTAAQEYVSVGQTSPFRNFGMIFAGMVNWLFWGQVPNMSSLLGFLFISVGVVWVFLIQLQ